MGIFGKQIGNPTASGVGLPVGTRVYRALLTQTGTDAPVATVLENTLGEVPTWTRAGVGSYLFLMSGDAAKCFLLYANTLLPFSTDVGGNNIEGYFYWTIAEGDGTFTVTLSCYSNTFVAADVSDYGVTPQIQLMIYP